VISVAASNAVGVDAAKGQLRSIQILRGIAALAVVLTHLGWGPGAAGVDIFFVISGFIMGSITRRGVTPYKFATDRLWRVFPPYLIALLPWLGANPTRGAASFTLWPIWGGHYVMPYLLVGWTLSFELLFYTAVTVSLWSRRPWLVVGAYACCLLGYILQRSALFSFIGSPMCLEFLFGLAIVRLPRSRPVALVALLCGAALLVGLPAANFDVTPEKFVHVVPWRALFWGVPAAMLVYGALCFESGIGRQWNPLVRLGDASYSLYLTHLGIVLGGKAHWPFWAAVAIIVGFLFWRFVERPLLRARRAIHLPLAFAMSADRRAAEAVSARE
jgi:exopolysaccharide production protein ExoZ